MATITDLAMKAKATDKEQWLTQPFKRGAGVFLGRITPAGERLFYFRYTDSKGRRPFLPIGSFHPKGQGGGLTVAQAYTIAAEWSLLYANGHKDLREHFEAEAAAKAAALEAERLKAEAEARKLTEDAAAAAQEAERRLTVRQLFSRWQATDLQPRTLADGTREGRKDGGAYVLAQFERHVFPRIGDLAAADLTRSDLMAVLDARKAAGTLRTANVLFSDLRQMLDFAADREIIPANPLAGVKRKKVGGKDTERDRVLSDIELRQLWAALPSARLNPRSRCALGLILATGARAGEVTGATWADSHADRSRTDTLRAIAEAAETKFGIVDLKARTWHLPDTKNQRAHTIHLSDFAMTFLLELAGLRELDESGESSPWLFPDRSRRQPVCVKSLGKQIADRQRPAEKRMSGRSKNTEALLLPGGPWTLHDLRRTAGTLMARLGISGDVIDECLNHKIESRVRRVYVHDRREADQARAFDALGVQLSALLTGEREATDNVFAMQRLA
ncbi:tyrosine-type recombinase/integrase [Inhella proteolytica]|uniref:Site-specific integrase n=1 Tax=Inhella proteolytica TaxID=2795029 RepID=A0A931J5E1_9BURK|nr:tyrosine-type recombinase/integrase [Inhella proteolytica]MBH9577859.1 site-specific integrase [Inhella proteolytica]